MDVIPTCSIRPSKIVLYNEFSSRRCSEKSLETHKTNFKSNLTQGKISKSAETKLRNSIDWLIFLSPYKKVYSSVLQKRFQFKINFITLTLPSAQRHDDLFIKKNMLNHFLQILRYKHKMEFYVWRAEAQKNGNIHFHITTNVFIEYFLIRNYWNRILDKYGYIKSYTTSMKKFYVNGFRMSKNLYDKRNFRQQYKAFIWNKLTGWLCPNSTDVHSVKNVKHLSMYLCKYFSKNSDERPIAGRLWFVSQKLGKLESAISAIGQAESDDLNYLVKHFKECRKKYDHAQIIYVPYDIWAKHDLPQLKKVFETYFTELTFNLNFKK